jgi:DNA invertase Pin-like site-specific DNA recombinase
MNIIYARKSSESEDRQVLSIQAQVSDLRALAERHGDRIDEVLEESKSAREPGRPVFSQILRLVEQGKIGVIYTWRLDRLARNPVDGGFVIHHLGHRRIARIVTPEGSFTGTGNDKLLMQIHFGMATKYVDDLAENVKRGNREVLKSGRVPGQVPLGYIKRARPDHGAGDTVPDPVRFPMVKALWEKLLNGRFTVAELVRHAEKVGLTIQGGRPVSYNGLLAAFQNPFYCGQIRRGGQVFAGQHEPMLTPADWQRAQALIRRRDAPRPSRHTFLFSGILACASCGRVAVGEEHIKGSGRRYVYYRCVRKYRHCDQPYVSEGAVVSAVETAIARLSADRELLKLAETRVMGLLAQRHETAARTVEALRKTLAASKANLDRLTDLAVSGTIPAAEYGLRREALEREIEALGGEMREPLEDVDRTLASLRSAADLCCVVDAAWRRAGSVEDQREILLRLVRRITVANRVLHLDYHEEIRWLVDGISAEPTSAIDTRLVEPEVLGCSKPRILSTADGSAHHGGAVG